MKDGDPYGPVFELRKRKQANGATRGRIESGEDFANAFVPPDWLIEGIVQKGRVYSCTSLTGHGKTAVWLYLASMLQSRRMAGPIETDGGNVLILAGENPEDLRARMNGMRQRFPDIRLPAVLPGAFPMDEDEAEALRAEIKALRIEFAAIIGDTAASFFPGDDEDDNVAAGNYARTLRTFTLLPGNPAIIFLAHPVKRAARDNLLPRGGSAFLNELDGNLTLWSPQLAELTILHWQGKIRGPDFNPLPFRLMPIWTGYMDRKDREVMTILALPMDEEEAANELKQKLADEDALLITMRDNPEGSYRAWAEHCGWIDGEGRPQAWKVQRCMEILIKDKLVYQPRTGKSWKVSRKGRGYLNGDGEEAE